MTPLSHRLHSYGRFHRRLLSLAAVLMVLMATPVNADRAIRLNDQTDKVLLSADARFLKDPSGSYQIEDILDGRWDDQFFNSEKERANFGFEGDIYWLHASLI